MNDWLQAADQRSELKRLWEPAAQGKIKRWSQVHEGWPDQEIHLFGAGTDSGTYDYFTKAIVGVEHSSRTDYTPSEDDDALVQDVANDANGLGFFGLAYYAKNRSRLKLLAIDDERDGNGAGPVAPSLQTVGNGTYQPLSRPMFIYVDSRATGRQEAAEFVRFFLREASNAVKQNDYVPLSDRGYELALARFEHRILGSLFHGRGSIVGVKSERSDGRQMTHAGIVVVGGSDAGISAGLRIKELAPPGVTAEVGQATAVVRRTFEVRARSRYSSSAAPSRNPLSET